MGRKMGFGFAPLNLFSKGIKQKPVEDVGIDIDDDLDLPFDNSFINRPPPLDPKTERELWKSCAVILQNLKPSGWDIEDTRMRSDMLVEDDEENEEANDFALAAAQAKRDDAHERSKRSKPLIIDAVKPIPEPKPRQVEKVPPRVNGRPNPAYVAQQQAVVAPEPQPAPPPKRDSSYLDLDYLPHLRELEPLESPPEPFHTAAPASARNVASPQPTAEEAPRPTTARRVGSSSTLASSRYSRSNSTNDINTTSTGFTSAAYTPDISSKRVSEQAIAESAGESKTTAAAGQWMKEEVDKRRLAETPVTAPAASKQSVPQAQSAFPSAQEAQDWQNGQSTSRSATPEVRYRDSQSSFSRPRSTGTPKEKKRAEEPLSSAATTGTDTLKTTHLEQQEAPPPPVPPKGPRGDPQLDRPQTPQRSKESVPPVPALPLSRDLPESDRLLQNRQKLMEGSENEQIGTQVAQSKQLDAQRAAASRLSPTSPTFPSFSLRPLSDASTESRRSQKSRHASRDSTTQKYQLIPIKHQEDESILVKDFCKSTAAAAAAVRRSGTTKSRNAQPVDIHAADFDDLMSFMRDTKEPVAAAGRDSPSNHNTNMVNLYADSVIDKKQQQQEQQERNQHPLAENQLSNNGTRSMSSLNGMAYGVQYSVRDGLASPASMSPSLHSKSSRTEPRGFKKVFGKWYGQESSLKKGVYVPPPVPMYYEAEEDDYYDSQACAAPVIGFGRGW